MPKKKNTRTPTEKIEHSVAEIALGENYEAILEAFSDKEMALFQAFTGDRANYEGISEDQLWLMDYIRVPPTIEEFLSDPYWLGETMQPNEENIGMWPTWKGVAVDDFDRDSNIHNVVITGSLGSGKSFFMTAIFLYRMTLVRLLRNPQNFLGLSRGSDIYYVVLSITKAVVQDTVFGSILNNMAFSEFFRDECGFDPDKKYSDMRIPLGKGVILSGGSKGQHIIGRNAMGVALDEGNFRLEGNPDMRAYQLYDDVRTRIKNRFQKHAGFLPAISILSSSAKDETSFTERVIEEITKVNNPSVEKVYRMASYVVRDFIKPDGEPNLQLLPRRFKVQYGLKNIEPSILNGWYDKNGVPIMESFPGGNMEHEEHAPGAQVELVPEDYFPEFKRRAREALQNISGISVGGSSRLFPSLVPIEESIKAGEEAGLLSPCKVTLIPASDENAQQIWDYLDHRKFLIRRQSRVEPLHNPSQARFLHLDLAKRSVAGLAMCHRVGGQAVNGWRNGEPFTEYKTIVQYDFILGIVAGDVKPISLVKIQKFIYWLRDRCNFNFSIVTADQYQSELPLQMFEAAGFRTDNLSVDKNKRPYYFWRNAFDEGLIRMYRHTEMLREAEALVDGEDKVDHPLKGCFTGDTRIPLLDGTRPTIAELEGREVWVYSCRPNGSFAAGKAVGRRTKEVTELLDVVLDSGAVIRCTPDHRFMLRDGGYVEAAKLSPGIDRLMALNQIWPVNGGYERVTDSRGRRELTHRLVSAQVHGPIPNGWLVHHKNKDKTDNRPENLEPREPGDHASDHTSERWATDAAYRANVSKGTAAFNNEFKGINHKVRHLIPVLLSEPVPVYDLGVQEWDNFLLSSGVIVHNSKDICDACCGAYYNAITVDADKMTMGVDTTIVAGHAEGNDDKPPIYFPPNPPEERPAITFKG